MQKCQVIFCPAHKITSAVAVCTRSQKKSPGKNGDTSENALKEVLNKIYNVVKKIRKT